MMRTLKALAFLLSLWLGSAAVGQQQNAHRSLLEEAQRGPLKNVREIVFVNRRSYDDSHWYANIGYYCNDENRPAYAGNGGPDCGRLCKLDLQTKTQTVLVDAGTGSIRDPAVHYDGHKILFSWRKADSKHYHLYEIGIDGSKLRQITSGPFDDYEACYLPSGDLAFISTRCWRWVACWKTQVGILYRCGPKGENIRRISANTEHDNTPAVLPDGRLLFTRWEYVDRSQVGYHHLWTMNPDGTGQGVFHGNQRHYPLYIDAHPIPGTDQVVGVESHGHGRRDHYGAIGIFSEAYGPDDRRGYRRISRGREQFVDPSPLSANCILVASGKQVLLMNGAGVTEALFTSEFPCHEPCPIITRPREAVLASTVRTDMEHGQLILSDVYKGRNMAGVKPGEVKKLLVIETLPTPVNFSGGPDLTSWLGTFSLERVLGTVPVEPDGSASFEVPAGRPVFFVALDDKDMSVARMQSFVNVMPGEVQSCVGCHEQGTEAPPIRSSHLAATRRPPSQIEPYAGIPDVLDFTRDIQPILDRHCVECHNWSEHAGSLSLEGDLGLVWSIPYYSLLARLQVADGRNGYGGQAARTIGSSASRLLGKVDGSHYESKVSEREWRTIWLWLESAAPYAGTYAALRNEAEMNLSGHGSAVFKRGGIVARRCGSCHGTDDLPEIPFAPPKKPSERGVTRPTAPHERPVIENDPLARFSRHVLLNLSRPEFSALLLAPLSKASGGWGSCGEVFADRSDPDYSVLLQTLRVGKKKRDQIPRYTSPGWRPNPQYVREMTRYGILPQGFEASRNSMDPFAIDQRYWRRLWGY